MADEICRKYCAIRSRFSGMCLYVAVRGILTQDEKKDILGKYSSSLLYCNAKHCNTGIWKNRELFVFSSV